MRLFMHLCRETGLTWSAAEVPEARSTTLCGRAATLDRAAFESFCTCAARCSAIVGRGVGTTMAAVERACDKHGVDCGRLAGVPRLELAAPGTPLRDAEDVAAAYFTLAPVVLKSGATTSVLPAGAAPTREQWEIMHAFERGLNVICRAVAGAGKTTTLIMCALRRRDAACVLLTYNKRLQLEVATRACTNLTPYTYHSAAGRSYGVVIPNDEVFRRHVRAAPEQPLRFDVLMVDEAQDMSIEYYLFVRHLLRANPAAQVLVVGDELQAINQYKGSRADFLTEAERLYVTTTAAPPTVVSINSVIPASIERQWVVRRLSISQRLTPATAAFVNTHLYGSPILIGGNRRSPNVRPEYIVRRTKDAVAEALAAAVKRAVTRYGPEGVFVLAPSVRNLTTSQSPIADLVRRHLAGVPSFVAGQDDINVDADLIRGKLAVLSFNAAKGCERPCVIVVGLDETYFDYFDREWGDPRAVPNVMTVACTRAIAHLVVLASSFRTLRTIQVRRLSVDADVLTDGTSAGHPKPPKVRNRPPDKERNRSVSDLIRHLHPETQRLAMESILTTTVDSANVAGLGNRAAANVVALRAAGGRLQPLTSKVRFGSFYEDLGFVYGVVAPVLAEVDRTGETSFGEGLDAPNIVDNPEDVRPFSADITAAEHKAYPNGFWEHVAEAVLAPPENRALTEWARICVARNAMENGHHHIARQVTNYDWVDVEALHAAKRVILKIFDGVPGEFEMRLPSRAVGPVTIVGRADFIEHGVIWEFKTAGELREEHVLQLACYIALNGGGEGFLVSITSLTLIHVELAPADAMPLLQTLAAKAHVELEDIFAMIARVDAEGFVENGDAPNNGTATPVMSWSLDEALGDD
jgi:AAA domain